MSFPIAGELSLYENGETLELDSVETDGNQISGGIPLQIGENQISLAIVNDLGRFESNRIIIQVKEPLSIETAIGDVSETNVGRVTLAITSAKNLDKASFRVLLNGTLLDDWSLEPMAEGNDSAADGDDGPPKPMTVTGIHLMPGKNRVEVQIVDDGGQPADRTILTLMGSLQPKQPDVTVHLTDRMVTRERYIEFSMDVAGSNLIELVCDVDGIGVPVETLGTAESGLQRARVKVSLQVGLNQISVRAKSNEGLVSTANRTVTRIPRPVELAVTSFTPTDLSPVTLVDDGKTYKASKPIPIANGVVEGIVRISNTTETLATGAQTIRAWVNGFLQSVVPLVDEAPGIELQQGEYRFRVPVLLSATENEIRLDLPNLVRIRGLSGRYLTRMRGALIRSNPVFACGEHPGIVGCPQGVRE